MEDHVRVPRARVLRRDSEGSLRTFKRGRITVYCLTVAESCIRDPLNPAIGAALAGLAIAAIGLRLSAICALGKYWSNHVDYMEGHQVIRTGPYRRIRHPAYIGNIHIPAIALALGGPVSALAGLALIVWLYAVRTPAEDNILRTLRDG